MQWRALADQIRPKVPKLAAMMDEAEHDVLAYVSYPKEHWTKLTAQIRSNGSMARDQAAHRGRGHLPTTPSSDLSAHCSSNRTMNGLCSARYISAGSLMSGDPLISLPTVAR